jgi:hypothetical protein
MVASMVEHDRIIALCCILEPLEGIVIFELDVQFIHFEENCSLEACLELVEGF